MYRSNLALVASAFIQIASAQSTLFTEDFEGASPAFTLNTTDAGSGISAWNTWVINNSYTGGSGSVVCFGFPFGYTIVNTPAQPAGISNANGKYLHTASVEGIADGITCCSFGAADGLCIPADNTFSRMSNDVSTVGYTNVTFSFWWVCEGGASYYGQVYYSTDGGMSWTATSSPAQYNFQGSWTQQSIALAAFDNQPTLRFGVRFVNAVGIGAVDPGFAIDDVSISAQSGSAASISCSVPQQTYCPGNVISVTCTASGTFTPGNIFTAELSDASGSFAAPMTIGSVPGTSSTVFNGTIPPGTVPGVGYRVRVVSTTPAVTGSSSAAFTVAGPPEAGIGASLAACPGTVIDLWAQLSGPPDAGGVWSPAGPVITVTSSQIYTYSVSNACGTDTSLVLVTTTTTSDAGADSTVAICKATGIYSLFDLLGGTPDPGGSWTSPAGSSFSGNFNSASNPGGDYTYLVGAGSACGADTAVVDITLVDQANAGNGGMGTLCSTAGPTPLIGLLTGSPDVTGYWLDPLGFVTNANFDPGIDPPGVYTYVVVPPSPCPNDTAELIIDTQAAPDAGDGGTITVCDDDPTVDLFTLLGGTPDVGGSWTGPGGGAVSNLFDPATDLAGLYIYTVDGAPACPDDDASLAMIIDPCNGINEAEAIRFSWLGQESGGTHVFSFSGQGVPELGVFDVVGHSVPTRVIRSGDRVLLDLSAPQGVYLVNLVRTTGGRTVRIAHLER